MIKRMEDEKPTTKNEYYCDVCGDRVIPLWKAPSFIVIKCEMCNKLLCDKCVEHCIDTVGDYSEYYCKSCWDKDEKYRQNREEE